MGLRLQAQPGLVSGHVVANEGASSRCEGVIDSKESMLSTNKWKVASYGPPPHGWGGDIGSSFAVYVPVSDSLICFRWDSHNLVEVLSLAKNRWSVFDPGRGKRFQPASAGHRRAGRNVHVFGRRPARYCAIPSRRRGSSRGSRSRGPRACPRGPTARRSSPSSPSTACSCYPNTVDYGEQALGLGCRATSSSSTWATT